VPDYLAVVCLRKTGHRGKIQIIASDVGSAIKEMVRGSGVVDTSDLSEYMLMELMPNTNNYIVRAERKGPKKLSMAEALAIDGESTRVPLAVKKETVITEGIYTPTKVE
jgi:hypothetical protein